MRTFAEIFKQLTVTNFNNDMKKISLLLFGALFALGARAQVYTNGEWRIDSTVTTKLDGQFLLKDVYHYDDNGLLVEI